MAGRHNLSYLSAENATLEQLSRLLDDRWVVTISYLEPEEGEGHYAIVQHVNPQHIVLADPYHGPDFSVARSSFRWETRYEAVPRPGWLSALRRKS